jgi:hypothetical protein
LRPLDGSCVLACGYAVGSEEWCGRTESNRRDLLGRQEFYH